MIQNYFDNAKRILGSLISNARAREGWGKGIYLFSFLKIIGSPTKLAMRAKRWAGQSTKSSEFCSKKFRAKFRISHQKVRESSPAMIPLLSGGAEGDRTPDLLNAIQALSQLSYNPLRPLKKCAAQLTQA